MKLTLFEPSSLAVALASPVIGHAQAMDMKGMEMKHMPMKKGNGKVGETHNCKSTVKSVDAKKGTVSLSHDPIQSMNWPAMTMTFKAKDKAMLDREGEARREGGVQLRAVWKGLRHHEPNSLLETSNMRKKFVVASAVSIACVTTAALAQQSVESTAPAADAGAPSWPVSGIWMPADAKDLGKLTGQEWLTGVKVRGWVDGYYVSNRNHPSRSTVDANQGASIVKGKNISVEGRTFDVQDQRPSLSLAEIEIEKIPELGGFGFKLDIAAGETQNVILGTISGALGQHATHAQVNGLGRNIQHASVSYIAPVGKGLRIDVGKFVTHIGGETIETVKNWNYSHSFFYTYAIPFQDTGARFNYNWSDTLYTELYILNGWNVNSDNNSGKTWGPSVGWTALPWLSVVANYLTGPEQNNNSSNQRHLFDTQVTFGPFNDRWTFMVNYDHGTEERVPPFNTTDAKWSGTTFYARYKINDTFEPSLRIENYRDPNGFTTGAAQKLRGYTLTLNTRVPVGKTMIMIRPEIRYDRSDANFFSTGGAFQSGRNQTTVGVGLSAMF